MSTEKKDSELATCLFNACSNKGGQDGIDRAKINSIILDLSEGDYSDKQKRNMNIRKFWTDEKKEKLQPELFGKKEVKNRARTLSTHTKHELETCT